MYLNKGFLLFYYNKGGLIWFVLNSSAIVLYIWFTVMMGLLSTQ